MEAGDASAGWSLHHCSSLRQLTLSKSLVSSWERSMSGKSLSKRLATEDVQQPPHKSMRHPHDTNDPFGNIQNPIRNLKNLQRDSWTASADLELL
ncbi:hypothetical protein EYF80_066687 [Liparis tanakae]|uniref:Uncharacterized protein n=1 Tax=Liparis tanakae TaxID=230148 RepID=A0A4Z2E337_9TELE|nr:hypothetical protein EYF80_066687 [Liparis tanakae]